MHARLTITIFVVILHLVATTARAHEIAASATFGGGTYCVVDTASMREDDRGNGIAKGVTQSYRSDCRTWAAKNPNFIAQKMRLYYIPPSGKGVYLCRYTPDWFYNARPARSLTLEYVFGEVPPCKRGWYFTEIIGMVSVGGVWRGGKVVSERHYLNP